MTRSSSARGFTLIELLVVIAIIGLLSSIVLASLSSARQKSRDARRLADIRQLQTALELYANDNGGTYPGTGGTWYDNSCDPSFANFTSLVSNYYKLPADPGSKCMWYYKDYPLYGGPWKYIITIGMETAEMNARTIGCYGTDFCVGMK
jgi:prepilin-type N-terminal cleavage/methylation domain-containing protein